MSRLEQNKYKTLVRCGVCLISPTGRSLRLEIYSPDTASTQIYYIGLGDLDNVLKTRKKTAPICKLTQIHGDH